MKYALFSNGTHNCVKFTKSEIKKACERCIGKTLPVTIDFDPNKVVGMAKIIEWIDLDSSTVTIMGKVKLNKKFTKKMNKIGFTSIGIAPQIEYDKEITRSGKKKAKNIELKSFGLTGNPLDPIWCVHLGDNNEV